MLDRNADTETALELFVAVDEALPDVWPSAADPAGTYLHVFQCREFFEVWQSSYGTSAARKPYYVTVRDGRGQLLLLAGFCIEDRGGRKVLRFIDNGLADYNAPVLYPNDIIWTEGRAARLWNDILLALPAVDLAELDKVPADVGGQTNPFFLLTDMVNPESAHGSDLRLSWPEIEATQAQLKTIKRKWRGLEKLGALRFHMAEGAEEIERVLARALEQKQRRFDETRIAGFDRDPEKLAYFVNATEKFDGIGQLQLCALELDGQILATAWNLVVGQTVYEVMIGYEAGDWAKYSPGRILNLMHMAWLKERGFTYLDHGIGDESWKLEYCDTHVGLGRVQQALTRRGHQLLQRERLKERLRKTAMWQRLRALKWHLQNRRRVQAAG
jgi:CelD/BcsL family acetyltransferase involved in cellulose biosynthesis